MTLNESEPILLEFPHLETQTLGRPCLEYENIESTQDLLKQLLSEKKSHKGMCLFAKHQYKGRGQKQNTWFNLPKPQFYLSAHWSLPKNFAHLSATPLCLGIAVAKCLNEAYGVSAQIKWPNDIYVQDKKLAGILCESFSSPSHTDLIFGIGINLEAEAIEIPDHLADKMTVLNFHMPSPERYAFLSKMLKYIENELQDFETSPKEVLKQFSQYDFLHQKQITAHRAGQNIPGIAQGITEDGQLLLQTQEGTVQITDAHIEF